MKQLIRLIAVFFVVIIMTASNGNPVHAHTERVAGAKISVTSNGNLVTVKWRGKKYRTIRLKRAKVIFISEGKLTRKMLLRRKAKRIVYVERLVGEVMDNALNGRTTNGNDIYYGSLRGFARKGDEVVTYLVYNPFTKAVDDVVDRFDVIL